MRRTGFATFLLLLFSSGALAQPADGELWRRMTEADLRFIHDTLGAHHPGPVDDENPAFREWQEKGLAGSLAQLDKVRSYGGYRAVLQSYVAGFRDGHLTLNLSLDYRWTGWPGFLLAWRDGRIVVHHVAPGMAAPAVGATLVSCDGIDAETLYVDRALRFGGKKIPADRSFLVPEILIDRVNPLLDDLTRCTFEKDGGRQEVELAWRWESWSAIEAAHRQAMNGGPGTFGLREIEGGGAWISFPTFGPGGDDLERMKEIMAALPQQRKQPFIVIDVRGNGGGSSYWAEAFVRGLYGDGYFEALRRKLEGAEDGHTFYRVSAENLEHFRELLDSIRAQAGEDSRFYRYFASLVTGLDAARERGEVLYADLADGEEEPEPQGTPPDPAPLYGGTVYLLTDAFCASACLGFTDVVRELPDHVQIGQPTNADTLYMEVRTVRLPSNNGRLTFATKVARGRTTRGHNEYYTPDHEWGGDIWRTDELEAWILSLHRGASGPQTRGQEKDRGRVDAEKRSVPDDE